MMAIPNLISLVLLIGMVKKLTDDYFNDAEHVKPEKIAVDPPVLEENLIKTEVA
jgi:hypothetical protein